MSQDYSNFFKNAKNSKKKPIQSDSKLRSKSRVIKNDEETAEDFLRKALNIKSQKNRTKSSGAPIVSIIVGALVLVGGALGYRNQSFVKSLVDRIDIGFFAVGMAADKTIVPENNSQPKDSTEENIAGTPKANTNGSCTEVKGFTEEELSHFNKLSERKDELDRREAELSVLEEELHKQKSEIEVRIGKLEQIREEVSAVLKERVEVDQQRVNTLVDFYSNMKPKQAADIFAKLNEDLAIEVLGRMKKKNAADILNLLAPSKAQAISEKFTGYTRR